MLPATASALSRETLSMGEILGNSVRDLESSHVLPLLEFKPRPVDFLPTSPTIETLICTWKLHFDCPVLSSKDLILQMTTVLKLRPVRPSSAQHLCKVLNILKAYFSM